PELEGRMVAVAPTLTTVPPNHAVNTDAHRRRCAPWWSPGTLGRLVSIATRILQCGASTIFRKPVASNCLGRLHFLRWSGRVEWKRRTSVSEEKRERTKRRVQ